MGIALAQQGTNAAIDPSGSTTSVTISSSGTGSLLVLCLQFKSSTCTLTAVTDNIGNTWTRAVSLIAGSASAEMWYTTNATAGVTTVSGTESVAATQYAANVSEWSGVATGAPLSTNSANVSTSPNRTGTVTPAVTGDLAIAMCARNSSTAATLTTTGGWLALTDGTLPAGVTDHQAYNITPDTTAVEGQWTTASGTACAGLIALFAPATVGGTPALPVVAPSLAAMQRSTW